MLWASPHRFAALVVTGAAEGLLAGPGEPWPHAGRYKVVGAPRPPARPACVVRGARAAAGL